MQYATILLAAYSAHLRNYNIESCAFCQIRLFDTVGLNKVHKHLRYVCTRILNRICVCFIYLRFIAQKYILKKPYFFFPCIFRQISVFRHELVYAFTACKRVYEAIYGSINNYVSRVTETFDCVSAGIGLIHAQW